VRSTLTPFGLCPPPFRFRGSAALQAGNQTAPYDENKN
jgi:hypothetical protein